MAIKLLVSGLLELESGKTWFTVGLATALRTLGARVMAYKPVAAYNIWSSWDPVESSLRHGILAGNDALIYIEQLGDSNIHLVNPVSLMLAYPDPLLFSGVAQYLARISSIEGMVVLARFSSCAEGSAVHYYVPENVERLGPSFRKIVEELVKATGATPISASRLVEKLSTASAAENLAACLTILDRSYDVVVIESFNNAVVPFAGLEGRVDYFIVVAPGRAIVFDGDKLRKVSEIVSGLVMLKTDKVLA
ncbi:hypothetical protein [Hyperthermus butylicus]|uniref:Conserved archaeal protein n=1 Tax=Hyperthermus butylicus (strain DSM 5456 / JCM 9403 / PLM1-5) TaxID=415426 RepID=A2BM38_HYPBU|nr:hypothetical protein [Hyperthermus butylicus]ABM81049.1 conserved archaeal protein [Hyperthermus butylicus DSM 5456]